MLAAGCSSEGQESVASGFCTSVKYEAPSGAANDIAFFFDGAYACGQFINGDWWVAAGADGTVTITGITPAATETGRHGWEVNPSDSRAQAFDSRINWFDAGLRPSLPLAANGSASIVKAVSIPGAEATCRPCLQFAAVLTVVEAPLTLSSEMFRPGYFGDDKNLYQLPVGAHAVFPQLPNDCCDGTGRPTFEWLAERFSRVQLDHLDDFHGRIMHPEDNMPHYGADIARDNAVAPLRMMLDDFNPATPTHRAALVGYLQMAVDLRSMAANGVGWGPNGGHGNGRKLPILIGGLLLGDDEFFEVAAGAIFSEDLQVYHGEAADRALYGQPCSDAQYWSTTRFGSGPRTCRDPYGYIDGGGWEIGGAYQLCCTAKPWKYTALVVQMLKLEEQWAYPPFFDYVQRWVTHGVWAAPDPCAAPPGIFARLPEGEHEVKDLLRDRYGSDFGPTPGGGCVLGSSRFSYSVNENGTRETLAGSGGLSFDGFEPDGGGYGNQFADGVWAWHKQQP